MLGDMLSRFLLSLLVSQPPKLIRLVLVDQGQNYQVKITLHEFIQSIEF
jgi:hypothetical protein